MEEWRDVEGFEGFYRVSNTGLVASCDRDGADGGRKRKGRTLSQWSNKGGQLSVTFSVDGESQHFLVSRLVAKAFLGSSSKSVMHLDLSKSNNNADNLRYMTRKEIMALTNKILCEFERIDKRDMTREKAREYFTYKDGALFWKKRSALAVKIGEKAGHLKDGERFEVNFCGNTYGENRIIYLYHTGFMPEYVLHKNGNILDNRIENLFECTASQHATMSGRVENIAAKKTAKQDFNSTKRDL